MPVPSKHYEAVSEKHPSVTISCRRSLVLDLSKVLIDDGEVGGVGVVLMDLSLLHLVVVEIE